MSEVSKPDSIQVSPETLQQVLGSGDLSKLTVPQRLEYYRRTCESLGLNPLTRPFDFIVLNHKLTMYAKKDATEQLRKIHDITLTILGQTVEDGVIIARAQASMPNGRKDEDIGCVALPREGGDSRANAMMKALTKAKRRVTLSICGLGYLDESELDTVPGARIVNTDEEVPVDEPAPSLREEYTAEVVYPPRMEPVPEEQPEIPLTPPPKTRKGRSTQTYEQWLQAALDRQPTIELKRSFLVSEMARMDERTFRAFQADQDRWLGLQFPPDADAYREAIAEYAASL